MNRYQLLLRISIIAFVVAFFGGCTSKTVPPQERKAIGSKVVWIAKEGNVSRSYEVNNGTLEQRFPEPGDVILCRTTEALGALGTGKAGEAYELDEGKKLRKIGEFALTRTDEELVKEYQKRRGS